MNAYDKRSKQILEMAAKVLGDTPAARTMIQNAYDLGRVDGGYEQVARTCAKFEIPLGAEATVAQSRKVSA